ncbi:DUF6783 domain-containing protein [uncultured Robinsoniella sp.]|uniref:DUF6783 domain-containing protein n=1 Tax=Robinsoniella sp. TaxID=2496533 RepID=UPI00374EF794
MKIHSCHLHASLSGIFAPNEGYAARYILFAFHTQPLYTKHIYSAKPQYLQPGSVRCSTNLQNRINIQCFILTFFSGIMK